MDVLVFAIVKSTVCFFGNGSVAVPYVCHIKQRTSGGEIALTVEAHVAVGFVGIAVADGEHFGNIERIAAGMSDFVFDERCAGKRPACPRFVLVLDRRHGDIYDILETESQGIGGD